MEFDQLQALVTIEREGTVSAAASALHTSQPAVSRAISRLEDSLGQALFDRTRNSISFNDAGRLALTHAHEILAARQRMRDAFDDLARRLRTLRVWSVAPAPTWKLTSLVADSLPGTILQTDLEDEHAVERAILNGDADLAITLKPLALPSIRCTPFMTEDLCVSAPPGHPLATQPSTSFSDLDGETFLVLEQVGFWKEVVDRHAPNAIMIIQKDPTVFTQLLQSTDLLGFATDVAENVHMIGSRAMVPLIDAEAHATYFLCAREAATAQTLAAFDSATARVP